MLFLHLIPINEDSEPLALEYVLTPDAALPGDAPEKPSPDNRPPEKGLLILPPRAGIFPAPEYSLGMPRDPVALIAEARPLPDLREKVQALFAAPEANVIAFTSFRFLTALKKLFLRLLLPDLTRGKKCVSVKSLVRLAALYKGIFREDIARNLKKSYEGISGRPETQLSGALGFFGILKKREERLISYFLTGSPLAPDFAPFSSEKILAALGENSFMLFTPLMPAGDGGILVWDLRVNPGAASPEESSGDNQDNGSAGNAGNSPVSPEARGSVASSEVQDKSGFVIIYDRGDLLFSPAGTVSQNTLNLYGISSAAVKANHSSLIKLLSNRKFREEACFRALPDTDAAETRKAGDAPGLNQVNALLEHPGYQSLSGNDPEPARLISILPELSGDLLNLALDYLYTVSPELLDQQYAMVYGEMVRDRVAAKRDDFIMRVNDLGEKYRNSPEALNRLKRLCDFLSRN